MDLLNRNLSVNVARKILASKKVLSRATIWCVVSVRACKLVCVWVWVWVCACKWVSERAANQQNFETKNWLPRKKFSACPIWEFLSRLNVNVYVVAVVVVVDVVKLRKKLWRGIRWKSNKKLYRQVVPISLKLTGRTSHLKKPNLL